jgi:acetyl-CoA C-acetyltransferase
MTESCIVGWAHTAFGKLEDPDVEALIGRVAGSAIADAGIAPEEIDGVFVGLFNNGFSKQDFPSSLALQSVPELRFKPATRYENACASGSAAVYGARDFIAAGRGRFALVIGAEKMTATPGPQIGDTLLGASYRREEGEIPAGFAGVFGRIAEQYFQRYGDQSDALAAIAAKNHKNGVDNPYAQMRRDVGFDFCRTVSEKNPYVAPPLKRTDCSLVSDGAAALILTDEDTARAMGKAIRCRAATSRALRAVRGPGPRRWTAPACRSTSCRSWRRTIASPSPNYWNTRRWVWRRQVRAPVRCWRAGPPPTAACRSTAPAA